MLEVEVLNVSYGNVRVLWDVSISIGDGEMVAVIGPNGAGKSTLLKTILGILRPISGRITLDGTSIVGQPPHRIVSMGMSLVPEGRRIFPDMDVRENIQLGTYCSKDKLPIGNRIEQIYEMFPILRDRQNQLAGTLSGGEQQMLAIGRALISKPKILMLDEPSLGLAPMVIEDLYDTIARLKKQGLTILLVEQNVYHALEMADRAYVIESGVIGIKGSGPSLLEDDHVKKTYLGLK